MELHLPKVTREKIDIYKQILKQEKDGIIPFWDIVVVSSGDEEQKKSYEQQIELKRSRGEIPVFVKYVVISDPPGAKIGNGGATMHVLEQLEAEVDAEQLQGAKVLLIHAGGYSQRLPNVSVIGKVFLAVPCGDPMLHMLDVLMITFVEIPARMNPGVFLGASDVILLFNGKGDWDMKKPGISAIGHPADIDTASTHGVFVIDQVKEVLEKYKQDPEHPAGMGQARCFLHKVTGEKMKESGAIIPGTDQVYVDVAFYFDWSTAKLLTKFYAKHKPLKSEIDAYGDFLQALGPKASNDYCNVTANVTFVTEDLVKMRRAVFDLLHDTPLNVVIFNQAKFCHMGTTAEYLHHLFSDPTLAQSFDFGTETMVAEVWRRDSPNSEKRRKVSFEDCRLMHSVMEDRASVSIGRETVVEYATIEAQVKIGDHCIISNVHLPRGSAVPDSSFLHTVPVTIEEGKVHFTTFAFDVHDHMKASVSSDNLGKLQYCKMNMAEALPLLFEDMEVSDICTDNSLSKCSLWHCQIFPVFPSRQESAKFAVEMMQRLKGEGSRESGVRAASKGKLMCVADMLQVKSISSVMDYHNKLRQLIDKDK